MPNAVPIDSDELAALRAENARLREALRQVIEAAHVRIPQGAMIGAVKRARAALTYDDSEPDDEQHSPIKVFGFGSEYEEEGALFDRDRAKDMNK